uniref:G-protein coupled receptors family 1 profile domain-containing protein n=1 Tax=Plectus sambesii TaxID=2011161 RepID=A0A914WMN1_9BILA
MAFCYWTIFSRLRDRARSRLRKMNERSQALEQSVVHGDEALALNGTATSGRSAQVTTWLEHQESERQRLLAQTRRTTSILASMVLIFGLSWLPHNVVSLIMEYDNNQMFFTFGGGPDLAYLINLFTHSIAMLNNVANPILYAWLNPTFREMVVRTFASMRSGSRAHLTSYENASLINSNSRTPRMRMTTGGGEETRAAAERAVLRAASANAAATSTPTTNGHAAKANNGNHVKDTNEAATVTPTLSTASETTNIASNPSIAAAHASTCAPTIPAPAPAPATTKPGLQTEKIAAARTASHPFDVTNFTAIPRMFDASTIVNGDTIALQQAELIRTPNFSILAQPASDKFQLYPIHDVDFLHHKIVDKTTASMPVSRRYFRAPVHQPVCRSTTELRLSNVDIFHWPNHVNAAANAAQENEF